jgi:transposase
MIKIDFNSQDIAELQYWKQHHPHYRVRRKMEVLYLKSQGLRHQNIAKQVGVCQETVTAYLKAYQLQGIISLKQLNFYTPKSALEPYREELKEYFQAHPLRTLKEAASLIEEKTGIKRSLTQVRLFLILLGIRFCNVKTVPI